MPKQFAALRQLSDRLLLSLCVFAISLSSYAGNCFPEQLPTPSAAEKKAIEQTQLRLQKVCTQADTQCGFKANTKADEISVLVTFAAVSKDGVCAFMPGGYSIYLYSGSTGDYLRTLSGY